MNHTFKKVSAFMMVGGLVVAPLAPAAYANTVEVTGNGAYSDQSVQLNEHHDFTAVQNNQTTVRNTVHNTADTGGNEANDNTGGDVRISTGNALASTEVMTMANMNQLTLPTMMGGHGGSSALISGNGAYSDTSVQQDKHHAMSVFQDNETEVQNEVNNNLMTGRNEAHRSTGGDVMLQSGHAQADTRLMTQAGANKAVFGGSFGAAGGGQGPWVRVQGNGAYSDQNIHFDENTSYSLVQNNRTDVWNGVENELHTGGNSANDSTGGDVRIGSGRAAGLTYVNTMGGLNRAMLPSMNQGGAARVALVGNGASSQSDVMAESAHNTSVFQGSDSWFNAHTDVHNSAMTGHNRANRSTGRVYYHNDPAIFTGQAVSETVIETAGGSNSLGGSGHGGWDLDFEFNLGSLLGW